MKPPRIWGESVVRPENTALRRALSALAGSNGRLLEAGCGAGRFVRTLKGVRPDFEAHGCDISQDAISLAMAYQDGVNYSVGSLLDLPYGDGHFDVALVIDVLEHLHSPATAIAELRRVLRPGGLLHALVPCEGQPLTLHWAMWKLNVAADLKERHGSHVQRFTRSGVQKLLTAAGFVVRDVSFSMHPAGQLKDVLTYLSREPWFQRARLDNVVFRQAMKPLWAAAYLEAAALSSLPICSVVEHITAVRE